jgi:lipopolysaccharide transport system permease protein
LSYLLFNQRMTSLPYSLITAFRSAMLGGPFGAHTLIVRAAASLALLLFGSPYFRRVERGFADVI